MLQLTFKSRIHAKCPKCGENRPEESFKSNKGKKLVACLVCREKNRDQKKERKELAENGIKKKIISNKRIPHKFVNEIEHKWCSGECKDYVKIGNFTYSNSTWDKLRYTCKDCDKQYRQRETTQDRLNKIVKCKICEKEVKNNSMGSHIQNCHSEETYQFSCDKCKLSFKHEKLYKRHLTTDTHLDIIKHSEIDQIMIDQKVNEILDTTSEKIKCFKCGYTCDRIDRMDQHMSDHYNVKSFHCDECDKKYISEKSLQDHIKKCHSPQKYICDKCPSKFRRSDHFTRHCKEVHGNNKITCSMCHRSMTKRNYRERHLKGCIINKIIKKYPGKSNWERYTSKCLMGNKISFETQKSYPDLLSPESKKNLTYDFYVKDHNLLIEVNGLYHYILSGRRNAKEIYARNILHDQLKQEYAEENNINLMIIDTRTYDDYDKISQLICQRLNINNQTNLNQIEKYVEVYLNGGKIEQFEDPKPKLTFKKRQPKPDITLKQRLNLLREELTKEKLKKITFKKKSRFPDLVQEKINWYIWRNNIKMSQIDQ